MAALGLNFNPDEELKSMTSTGGVTITHNNGNGNGTAMKMMPAIASEGEPPPSHVTNLPSWVDESCVGVGGQPNEG